MRKAGQYLITGCGHQGTGWMARAMNLLGHATGHEWVYNFGDKPRWANLEGESSWPAAAKITEMHRSIAVMHLTRHPMDVVASVHNSNFLRSNCTCEHEPDAHRGEPYVQYILAEFPDLWDIRPDEVRATAWVVMWNRLVESNAKGRFYRRFKIEDVSSQPSELVRAALFLAGIVHSEELAAEVQSLIPSNFNTHRRNPEPILTMDDLPAGYWRDQLRLLINDYGYGDTDGSQ